MKQIFFSACILGVVAFSACSNQAEEKTAADTLSSVIIPDTSAKPVVNLNSNLNYTDADGKRQGHWKIYGKMQENKDYGDLSLVEEGDYKDGLKEGEWKLYAPDGKVKKTVKYNEGNEVK